MDRPRIQVILLDDIKLPIPVRTALQQVRAKVRFHRDLSGADAADTESADARLVVTTNASAMTNGRLGRLTRWFDDNPCPTLVLLVGDEVKGDFEPPLRVVGDRSIGFATRLSQDELAGRLTTMCGISRPFDVLRRELEALKRHDQALLDTVQRLKDQLQEAGAIQRDLFRGELPTLRGAEVGTMYRPAEALSGDVYRVSRIDDTRIAISMADATGHGLPAAVLSVFIQRMLVAVETVEPGASIPAPDTVLSRWNEEILSTDLKQCQFVAALYAIYDERTRTLEWARGGLPHPILVRPGQAPQTVESEGVLLGVREDAVFQTVRLQLNPGDTVVFHTDGLDALVRGCRSQNHHGDIHRVAWFQDLGTKPLTEHLADLESALTQAQQDPRLLDDATVVALHLHRDGDFGSICDAGVRGLTASRLSST